MTEKDARILRQRLSQLDYLGPRPPEALGMTASEVAYERQLLADHDAEQAEKKRKARAAQVKVWLSECDGRWLYEVTVGGYGDHTTMGLFTSLREAIKACEERGGSLSVDRHRKDRLAGDDGPECYEYGTEVWNSDKDGES